MRRRVTTADYYRYYQDPEPSCFIPRHSVDITSRCEPKLSHFARDRGCGCNRRHIDFDPKKKCSSESCPVLTNVTMTVDEISRDTKRRKDLQKPAASRGTKDVIIANLRAFLSKRAKLDSPSDRSGNALRDVTTSRSSRVKRSTLGTGYPIAKSPTTCQLRCHPQISRERYKFQTKNWQIK